MLGVPARAVLAPWGGCFDPLLLEICGVSQDYIDWGPGHAPQQMEEGDRAMFSYFHNVWRQWEPQLSGPSGAAFCCQPPPPVKGKAPSGPVCALFGEQLSGGCQRGMIYKVETSLKCAGVCGSEPGGESERRKMQTERLAAAGSLGWGSQTARRMVVR